MKPDSTIYEGVRTRHGCCRVTVDGRKLRWQRSLKLANHSPTGPEWGYIGAGPAQLALAILLDFLEGRNLALAFYQDWERDVVSVLPHGRWMLSGEELRQWCERRHSLELDRRGT